MHEGNDEGRNNDPPSLRYGAAGEASILRDPRSIASNFSSCKGIFFPGFLIFVRRFALSAVDLAEEVFGAFEEALVQRTVLLADERGKFLQLSPLFRIQACRHLHHHARE